MLSEYIKQKAHEDISSLGGLTDKHIKAIVFYVSHICGFTNYRIDLDYKNKIINVHVFTKDGQEMYVKNVKTGIDKDSLCGYTLTFAERK